MHIPRGLLILDEVSVSADILFCGVFGCLKSFVDQGWLHDACTNNTELSTKQRVHIPAGTPESLE